MTTKASGFLHGIGIFLIGASIVGCSAAPDGQKSSEPTASRTSASTPSPTLTLTPSPTVAAPVATTCADISTAGFQAHAAVQGWESQEKPADVGSLFEGLPGGDGVTCWWVPAGSGGTDNGVHIAWASIEAEDATAAEQRLVAEGGTRIETPAGVYITFVGQGGGERVYLFTDTDVRYSLYAYDLGVIKAPDENG